MGKLLLMVVVVAGGGAGVAVLLLTGVKITDREDFVPYSPSSYSTEMEVPVILYFTTFSHTHQQHFC